MPTFSSTLSHARAPFFLVPLLALLASGPAQAANPAPITTPSSAAQTLGAGQTLSVTRTGSLTVSGKTVAISVSGAGASIDNQGAIAQVGTGRAILDTGLATGLTITNGSSSNHAASITTISSDVVQLGNTANESVTLNNYGAMTVTQNPAGAGAQAVDFNGVTGANTVNNYAQALLQALNADSVRPGLNGSVNNWGTIRSVIDNGGSASAGSDGVDVQNNSGVTINNKTGGFIDGGRDGVTGGSKSATVPFVTTINNDATGVIRGNNGSGINLDGLNGTQSAVVTNAGRITGNGVTGDGDGVDVDGLVTLVNTGVIQSLNAVEPGGVAFSEGLSVGGGTITNSGTIEGLVAAGNTAAKGIGITLTGNDITSGSNIGNRDGLYGNTTLTNSGFIHGQNSSAIVAKGLASAFSLTITNAASGLVQGGGTTDAAIQLGADSATLTNAGKIDGSASGRAIDMGTAGNNKLVISGGGAVVLGSIDGGTGGGNSMKIDPGAGNSFSFASGISNFDKMEIASGTTTLSGVSGYTGTTSINAGATLVLDGANRLAAGSSLDLEGGMLKLVDVAGPNGQEFAVLALGQDSAIDLGDSSLTLEALGNVAAGKTLGITDYLASASPTYALRFLGDLTHDAGFLALMGGTTIDGLAATYRFDGGYTDVTAVPEPANIALVLAGLGLVGLAARRRRPGLNA